jgi:hypothetical protein
MKWMRSKPILPELVPLLSDGTKRLQLNWKGMFTQLEPSIPVHVIDKGDGYAFAVIDYGQDHNLIWVTALNAGGEIWCAPNPKVRVSQNWTVGRERE